MRRQFLARTAAMTAAAATTHTFAQSGAFPDRPIRVIVAFAPGGSVDPIIRILQPKMAELLGQPIVIENRPGGTSSIAAGAVTKSPADGYTLLFTAANTHVLHTINAPHIPYDPIKDFTSIAAVSRSGYVMATHPSIPANTIAELIAYCKANPGKVSFASSGVGNADHLSFERFNLAAGIKTVHVPYKAAATAYLDLLAGRVQAYFTTASLLEPGIQAGRLRGLAYTAPDGEAQSQKTFTAAGMPELDTIDSINVLIGPGNLPAAVVARLQGAVEKSLAMADVKTAFKGLNQYAYFMSGAQLHERMRNNLAAYTRILKEAGLKLTG